MHSRKGKFEEYLIARRKGHALPQFVDFLTLYCGETKTHFLQWTNRNVANNRGFPSIIRWTENRTRHIIFCLFEQNHASRVQSSSSLLRGRSYGWLSLHVYAGKPSGYRRWWRSWLDQEWAVRSMHRHDLVVMIIPMVTWSWISRAMRFPRIRDTIPSSSRVIVGYDEHSYLVGSKFPSWMTKILPSGMASWSCVV